MRLYDVDEFDDDDDDVLVVVVESRDDFVWDVFNVFLDDCDDFVDLVVLREGERTGMGAVLCVEDDDDGRLLAEVDGDAEDLFEEE